MLGADCGELGHGTFKCAIGGIELEDRPKVLGGCGDSSIELLEWEMNQIRSEADLLGL